MGIAPRRLVFFASGRGSCFEALCRAIETSELPDAQAVGLICNRPEAPVLKIAQRLGVPTFLVDHKTLDRESHERQLSQVLEKLSPDWICLAGYMRLLGPALIRRWQGRIVNIHPSLLPKHKGLHAVRQALQSGDLFTGCTVHFVTEGMDEGPTIAQGQLEIRPDDTEQSLSARLLPIEHKTYIQAMTILLNKPKG